MLKKLRIVVPLALLGIAALALGMFYKSANSQPYPRDIDPSQVPTFVEAPLGFANVFDADHSLPVSGSAIIDIDGDGVPELVLGGGRDQADAVFRFVDGAFVDISEATGITKSLPDTTYGMAVIDADGDGDADLFVARDSGVHLYTNDQGVFSATKIEVPFNEKSVPMSIALADLNRDGAVDMFVSNYLKKELMEGQNIFNKEGYGATSLLLLNKGDNTFTDITASAGMEYVHNTFVGVFVDVDGDRELDLVVAHDTGHVKTWKNNGDLTFTDTPNPTTSVYGYPMGIGVGDYNNDGRVDFFFSNTGGTAPRFLASGDLRDDQTFEDRLIFFRNDGDFKFTNVNTETKTADYEFSWGILMNDFNLDGLQDLVISQNYIALPPHKFFRLPGRFLVQKPDHTFVSAEEIAGVVNRNYEVASLNADFNGDGYPDLVRVNLDGPARAFLSQGGDHHYLRVRLPDIPHSLGAVATLVSGSGKTLTEFFIVGEGLASDQTHVLTFGLGDEVEIKSLTVAYSDGTQEVIASPKVDTLVTVGGSR